MLYFCEDITASKTTVLLGIHHNTINRYFNLFRQKIAVSARGRNKLFSGTFELDESYFGAKRIRGKRGRGAAGKTPLQLGQFHWLSFEAVQKFNSVFI